MNARIMQRVRKRKISVGELCVDDQINLSPLPDIADLATVTSIVDTPAETVRVVVELQNGAKRGITYSNRDKVELVTLERRRL